MLNSVKSEKITKIDYIFCLSNTDKRYVVKWEWKSKNDYWH